MGWRWWRRIFRLGGGLGMFELTGCGVDGEGGGCDDDDDEVEHQGGVDDDV